MTDSITCAERKVATAVSKLSKRREDARRCSHVIAVEVSEGQLKAAKELLILAKKQAKEVKKDR